MHLLSDELPEARLTGEKILAEARKANPIFLERADKPDRGGATTAYLATTRQCSLRRPSAGGPCMDGPMGGTMAFG